MTVLVYVVLDFNVAMTVKKKITVPSEKKKTFNVTLLVGEKLCRVMLHSW